MRLALIFAPGFDVQAFRLWASEMAEHGLVSAYDLPLYPAINYPPFFLYFLWLLGQVHWLLSNSDIAGVSVSAVPIKLIIILAEMGTIAAILLWLRSRYPERRLLILFAVAAYAFNPALIWNGSYWGGIDALDSLFAVLAILCLIERRWVLAWFLATIAVLTKPLVAPLFFLLIWVSIREQSRRDLWRGPAVAAVTGLLLYLPWLLSGKLTAVLKAMEGNVGNYAYLSVNAHNFWWLVSGGDGWRSDMAGLSFLSFRTIGLLTFSLAAFWVLRNLPARPRVAAIWLTAAYLLLALPVLTTEAHENWTFAAIPPLLVASLLDRRLLALFGVFSGTFLVNLAVHDPGLKMWLGPNWNESVLYVIRLANSLLVTAAFAFWTLRLPRWLERDPQPFGGQ